METTKIAPLLSETCKEVLEKMMFLEAWEKPPYVSPTFVLEKELVGSIRFNGQLNGRVIINCSSRLAKAATISFLGLEPEAVQEEQVRDMVREMANMVCGSLFGKLNTETSIAKLAIPEFLDRRQGMEPEAAVNEVTVFPFSCGALTLDGEEDEIFLVEMEIETLP